MIQQIRQLLDQDRVFPGLDQVQPDPEPVAGGGLNFNWEKIGWRMVGGEVVDGR